jgi:peptidyl-prolyl cis-trans isomerase D
MRKHASSWIIKFILGAVILAFIPFGYGIYRDRRDAEVARVNDRSINFDEFNKTYNNLLVQVRENFGDAFNEDLIKSMQLKKQALDQLIDRTIFLQEARDLGIRISDEEVAASIRQIEVFQTAGVFDPRRYEYVLDRNRLDKETFETQQKEALLIDRLRNFIIANVKISEAEARAWYNWNNATVNLEFVAFSPNRYQGLAPTDEQLEAYFEAHKEDYKTEEERKVRYLLFDAQAYASRVSVEDAEIQAYYDAHPEEFSSPKTVEARHILIKVAADADPETVEKARQRAEEIRKMALDGEDFAELAKQYSEGPTKDRGGYLGAFQKEQMVKPFSDAAFAMEAGDISEPVRTDFGWHVIKVEKINAAGTTPLEAARKQIRLKIVEEKARTLAYDEAELVYETTFDAEDLVRNAAERNMTLKQTDFFPRSGPQKDIEDRTDFASAAFELETEQISDLVELSDGYCLMEVVDILAPRIPEFEDVRARVRADWIKAQQDEKAKQDAEALLAALKDGKTMLSESGNYQLRPESTGFFERNGAIPKIGFNRPLTSAAFSLTSDNPLPEEVFKVNRNYYVVRLNDRREPPASDFEQEKENVESRLVQQKQFQTLESWLASKRNASEIKIEESFLQ